MWPVRGPERPVGHPDARSGGQISVGVLDRAAVGLDLDGLERLPESDLRQCPAEVVDHRAATVTRYGPTMNILVTNDDGIDSVGLPVLARALRPHGDVVIAAPDHHHVLAAMLACQAGMDVYVEKPLSLAKLLRTVEGALESASKQGATTRGMMPSPLAPPPPC